MYATGFGEWQSGKDKEQKRERERGCIGYTCELVVQLSLSYKMPVTGTKCQLTTSAGDSFNQFPKFCVSP